MVVDEERRELLVWCYEHEIDRAADEHSRAVFRALTSSEKGLVAEARRTGMTADDVRELLSAEPAPPPSRAEEVYRQLVAGAR